MSDFQFNIKDFIHELSDIPLSDQLVSLHPEKSGLIELEGLPIARTELELNSHIRTIVRVAQNFRKEADVNSLCVVHSVMRWMVNGTEQITPLFLFPADWSISKQSHHLQFQTTNEFELNPYVKRVLRNWTDESFTDWDESSTEEMLNHIENLKTRFNLSFDVVDCFYLGNFHYHRYHILRELESIDRSEDKAGLIDELLGSASTVQNLNLPSDCLTPVDVDQLQVFNLFSSENVVVQGPPGTGKSQVLTNVLGKLMAANKRTLVVSEKKVALEVLVKKLSELGLGSFTFTVHSQTKSKDLVLQMKSTWQFLEEYKRTKISNLKLSEQRLAQLQLLLNRLNNNTLIGGVSFSEFQDLVEETSIEKVTYSSDVPSVSEWLNCKRLVQEINTGIGSLAVLGNFRPSFFQEENGDVLLESLEQQLLKFESVFGGRTWQDVQRAFESLGRCRLVENEWFKGYSTLLRKPKDWKIFERNRLRFTELETQLATFKSENQIWNEPPSTTQIESWELASSFWQKRSRNKAIRSLLKDKTVDLDVALRHWKTYSGLKEELNHLHQYFLELGLPSSSVHLEAGAIYARHIQQEQSGLLSEVALWSREKRKTLLDNQKEIEEFVQCIIRFFEPELEQDLVVLLQEKRRAFEALLPSWKKIQELNPILIRLCSICSTWQEIQARVLLSNWRKTEALFPELAKFDGNVLTERIEQTILEQDSEAALFAAELLNLQKKKFDENETLLLKPSQKCKGDEKELRAKLKRGKAILVKEFAKSRTHASIRELLASEAGLWIQDLIPIWLATPTQVADHFPLRKHLFDTVVFDEASQIPLPNAFGALFRSDRALVAGDEQQMSPTSYFGKTWSGHDLLHQASFYFKKASLKHHYRSAYPELISFSNTNFYKGELLVYPSADIKQVVFRHRVEGKFIDRKNTIEAKAVAAFLENLNWKQTVGIVAFSEEQLKTIWQACSAKVQEHISIGQERNTVFFKTLEQVQGDEADCLVISMGYAPNDEEDFHLRFGPLNQANGYKRLNVLLTRAIREMHFFTSVDATAFGISANESVNLLRKFLVGLEEAYKEDSIQFPYSLRPTMQKGKEIAFPQITQKLQQAEELVTFHRVMKQRGWRISYNK